MIIKDRQSFSQQLRRFLWSDQVAPLLDEMECGWFDGGCCTCAMSLYCYLLLSQAVDPSDLLLEMVADQRFPATHVVVSVIQEGETWYLDANGIQTEKQLLRYWEKEEGCVHPWVRSYNTALLTDGHSNIPLHPDISLRLTRLLWAFFGPFSPDWFRKSPAAPAR